MEDAEDQAASAVMEDDEGPLPQNTDRELSSPDVLRAKAAEAQKARVGMAETMAEATEALEAVQRSMNSSLVDDETANEAEAEIEDEVGEELVDTVPENTIDEDKPFGDVFFFCYLSLCVGICCYSSLCVAIRRYICRYICQYLSPYS